MTSSSPYTVIHDFIIIIIKLKHLGTYKWPILYENLYVYLLENYIDIYVDLLEFI